VSNGVTNWLDGVFGNSYGFLGSRSGNASVNGVFVDVDGVVMETSSGRSVYGVVVGRLEAFTGLTLGNVNGAGEGFGNVNLDVSVRVFGARSSRTGKDSSGQ
jgi:hypothetical protein